MSLLTKAENDSVSMLRISFTVLNIYNDPGSSVSTVIRQWARRSGFDSRKGRGRDFFLHCVHFGSGAQSASSKMRTGCSFPGDKSDGA
jgi:hypothetical protein